MSRTLPKASSATQPQSSPFSEQVGCGSYAAHTQQEWSFPSALSREDLASELRSRARSVVMKATTVDKFAARFDVALSTMSRSLRGDAGHDLNWEHLAEILKMPGAIELGNFIAEQLGCRPLEYRRVVTDAEVLAALDAELDDGGPFGKSMRERLAKRLGVDVGALKR